MCCYRARHQQFIPYIRRKNPFEDEISQRKCDLTAKLAHGKSELNVDRMLQSVISNTGTHKN